MPQINISDDQIEINDDRLTPENVESWVEPINSLVKGDEKKTIVFKSCSLYGKSLFFLLKEINYSHAQFIDCSILQSIPEDTLSVSLSIEDGIYELEKEKIKILYKVQGVLTFAARKLWAMSLNPQQEGINSDLFSVGIKFQNCEFNSPGLSILLRKIMYYYDNFTFNNTLITGNSDTPILGLLNFLITTPLDIKGKQISIQDSNYQFDPIDGRVFSKILKKTRIEKSGFLIKLKNSTFLDISESRLNLPAFLITDKLMDSLFGSVINKPGSKISLSVDNTLPITIELTNKEIELTGKQRGLTKNELKVRRGRSLNDSTESIETRLLNDSYSQTNSLKASEAICYILLRAVEHYSQLLEAAERSFSKPAYGLSLYAYINQRDLFEYRENSANIDLWHSTDEEAAPDMAGQEALIAKYIPKILEHLSLRKFSFACLNSTLLKENTFSDLFTKPAFVPCETLIFTGNHTTINVLWQLPRLRVVEFWGWRIQLEEIPALANMLAQAKGLESVMLKECGLTNEHLKLLARGLKGRHNRIRTLCIQNGSPEYLNYDNNAALAVLSIVSILHIEELQDDFVRQTNQINPRAIPTGILQLAKIMEIDKKLQANQEKEGTQENKKNNEKFVSFKEEGAKLIKKCTLAKMPWLRKNSEVVTSNAIYGKPLPLAQLKDKKNKVEESSIISEGGSFNDSSDTYDVTDTESDCSSGESFIKEDEDDKLQRSNSFFRLTSLPKSKSKLNFALTHQALGNTQVLEKSKSKERNRSKKESKSFSDESGDSCSPRSTSSN